VPEQPAELQRGLVAGRKPDCFRLTKPGGQHDRRALHRPCDGSGIRKITDTEAGCFQPRWSPDGKRIVFRLGWEKDHVGLFVMDSDGGHLVQIINRLK